MTRFRAPKAKAGELLVKYGKHCGDLDLFYCYPSNELGMRRDSRLLSYAFEGHDLFDGKNLRQELIDRGYDITTLKFSIKKRPTPPKEQS
jgi:hypothetical protein